ncbi:MAG: class I adenylate-forming enzyme family protein [Actinomycetota bacterium]
MPDLVAVALSGQAFLEEFRRLWDSGDAVLPVDPSLAGPGRRALLERLRPSLLIDAAGETSLPGKPVESGTAWVVATSGSSGVPKAAVLSRAAVEHSARAGMKRIGYRADERWLVCLPVHHIAGLMMLVRSELCGSQPVVHDRFDTEAVAAEKETSLIALVPTALQKLIDAGADLARYTAVRVGGAGLSDDLARRAAEAGIRLVNGYGMTETCGGCVYDGRPLDGVEVEIGESEEVLIRGAVLMDGYRLDPFLTAEKLRGGWLHTGDRGALRDGRLEVLGRLDDLIISGGENIDAAEVEQILMQHPRIAQCAVIGLPDEKWGQVVAAAVVPHGSPPDLGDLRDFVGARASRRIAPRRLAIVGVIPRTSTGKVLRSELAELFLNG